jgi:hypothetical protein
MNTNWTTVRDALVVKRSTLSTKEEKEAWDRELGRLLNGQLTEESLVFCMMSGKAMPKKDTITAAYLGWHTEGQYQGVAGVRGLRDFLLFYEDPACLAECQARAKEEFDKWVVTGGLHCSRQWSGDMGGGKGHYMPHEIQAVRMDEGELQVYTELYQRWINTSHLASPGFYSPHDYRRCDIFEQIRDISCGNWEWMKSGQVKSLFSQLELPPAFSSSDLAPNEEWRRVSRPESFWRGYKFI